MFFSRTKKEKNILIFDIGSSSVNCFILSEREGEVPKLSVFARNRLPLLEDPDPKHTERYVNKAVREISEHINKQVIKIRPELIYITLSVPWYFSETKNAKISRREDFKVTRELLDKAIEEEVELFARKAREKFSGYKGDVSVLEREIMKFVVNGYPIKNPYSKTTKQLEFSLFLSAGRKNFIQNISDMFMHYFGHIPVRITSEPFPVFSSLCDVVDPVEGFLVVDVGGEVTEVYLVRGGVLENVKSFIWGGNLVIRRIAASLNIELNQALSLFSMKNEGDAKPEMDSKLSKTSEGVCSQWQNFLSESLADIGNGAPLPQSLVLLGGVAGSDILKKCLNSPEFSSLTILGKPFNVIDLYPENFEGKILTDPGDRKDLQMTLPLLLALSAKNYGSKN